MWMLCTMRAPFPVYKGCRFLVLSILVLTISPFPKYQLVYFPKFRITFLHRLLLSTEEAEMHYTKFLFCLAGIATTVSALAIPTSGGSLSYRGEAETEGYTGAGGKLQTRATLVSLVFQS
jgi:hypothetical protein